MNNEESEKISVLLKRRVNKLGEIHLDKIFTGLVIEMIEIEERQLATANECVRELKKMIEDAIKKEKNTVLEKQENK